MDDSDELEELIEEQKKDQEGKYVYPEKINPQKPVLFVRLTNRQKACLFLSIFMRRRDIADAMDIEPGSVTQYLKMVSSKLPEHELNLLAKIRAAL